MLRLRTLDRSSKYIAYLEGAMRKVTIEEYRQALISLMADQEKRRMFASSASVAFAAEEFQKPTASDTPTEPRAPIVLLISVILGILTGGFFAYARNAWMTSRVAASGGAR
jgi:uncharacterized protein involved in exopolysaccharide biosynthesis